MGKKKPQQLPYEQNTQYQEWKPSETQDTAALRAMSPMPESLAPALQSQYDRAQELSSQRWNSAYGSNMPDFTRRAMQGQEQRGLMADYGSAMGQAAFDANNANYARRMQLAQMTLGRPLQSRSYGYQSQMPQSNGILNSIIGGAAQIGSAAIMAGSI